MNIKVGYGITGTGYCVARGLDLICRCSRCELSCPGSASAERWVASGSFHWLLMLVVWLVTLAGCAPWSPQNEIERADDLGLITDQLSPSLLQISSIPKDYTEDDRNQFVEEWMARSDYLCRQYKDKIIRFSRNTRFATDATSTILSGLATIFTAVATIHPLTGAATIVSGVGAAAQTDTFAQQSGEVVASAIQTARENQANQIEFNLKYNDREYNIYKAQRDVIEYHNMCSMETALAQIRASLKATSPDAGKTPPAAQGTQNPGGAPPDAQSGPSPLLRPPAGAMPPPPPIERPIYTLPPAPLTDPYATLTDADFNQLRVLFGLGRFEATNTNSPRFIDKVKSFQQCLGKNPVGFLTRSELARALEGDTKCMPRPAPTGPASPRAKPSAPRHTAPSAPQALPGAAQQPPPPPITTAPSAPQPLPGAAQQPPPPPITR